MLHLKCLTVFWIRLCLDNCSVIFTVTLCHVLHQTHSGFWHIQHPAFSDIYRRIQSCSALLRHIHDYWDIIKAYSGLFSIFSTSQLWYILRPSIFRTPYLFITLWNVDQAYSEPCHRALFSHIQTYSEPCATHTQKPGILKVLEYSESVPNCTLTHIQ